MPCGRVLPRQWVLLRRSVLLRRRTPPMAVSAAVRGVAAPVGVAVPANTSDGGECCCVSVGCRQQEWVVGTDARC